MNPWSQSWRRKGRPVVKVDRRIRWHYTTRGLLYFAFALVHDSRGIEIVNFTVSLALFSRHADGISRYSVPPSAGPLLPLRKAQQTTCQNPQLLTQHHSLCSKTRLHVNSINTSPWLRKDLKEDQSAAEWVCFQRFSEWRRVDRKAWRVGVNRGFDGDWCLEFSDDRSMFVN